MKKHVILIVAFLVAIWLPMLQMSLRFYEEFDNQENRELARPPEWKFSRLKEWPVQCNAYVSDHFGMRPDLIRWNSVLRVNLLGVSPVESVILGKGSWLFYRSEALEDGDTFNDHMGSIPLSGEELVELRRALEANQRELSSNGIVYLVVIAPNKNTVYGEHLPDGISEFKTTTRMDQFMAHMRMHSGVKILDLREVLSRAKAQHPTYLRTDSHWNSYGAYIGYREIVRSLAERFPDVDLQVPSIVAERVEVETRVPGGDMTQMLFMQDLLPEPYYTKFDLQGQPVKPPLDTLLFRHDSFGDNLYPFLTPMFREIVNLAPFAPFDFEAIRRQRPDVVLHVFVERYLPQAVFGDFFHKSVKARAASR